MLWLYNFGILLYSFLVKIASLFNPKAKLFVSGRKNIFATIERQIDSRHRHIWFHFASLGEFEQGRPVLEKLKENAPERRIVVTFFSPSGYEIRKNYALATGVFYLPLDTRKNAAELIRLINPEIAVFTKYEFWHHYFKTLHDRQIPLFIISGIFRPQQLFFKWYGSFYRNILKQVSHFFVQNEESVSLLQSIHLHNVSLSGDTRFDRVAENAASPKDFHLIRNFCGSSPVLVAGSTWAEDEELLKSLIEEQPDWKFIIAPHEINASHLDQIIRLLPGILRYTTLQESTAQHPDAENSPAAAAAEARVLLIDNIGMLSSVYRYAKVAYIGGGFGAGIHNTLEAAAFGIPVLFGPKYEKFQEAKDLIAQGAAISINSGNELSAAFNELRKDSGAGEISSRYVHTKTGSTKQIVGMLETYI